jgi:hypothetical protein
MTDLLPLRVRSSVPRQHQSTRVRLSPHPRLFSAFLFCPPHHRLSLRLAHPSSAPLHSSHPRLFSAFLFCPPHHRLSLRLAHPSSATLHSSHPRLFSAFLFCPPHHRLSLRLAHPSSVPRQHQSTRVRLSIPPSPLRASILGVIVSLLERGFALVGRTDAER